MARGQSNRAGSGPSAAVAAGGSARGSAPGPFLNGGEMLDAQFAHARGWGVEIDQRGALMMMAPATLRFIRLIGRIARAAGHSPPVELFSLTQSEIEFMSRRALAGEDIVAVSAEITEHIAGVCAHGPLGAPWDHARAQWHACDRLIGAIAAALGVPDHDHRGDDERPGELRRALVVDLQRLIDRESGPPRALDLRAIALPGGGAPSAGLLHRLRAEATAFECARLNDPERAGDYVQLVAGVHMRHIALREPGRCAPVVAIARTLAAALVAQDADMYRPSPEKRARAWAWMNAPQPAMGGLSPVLALTRSPEDLAQALAAAATLAPDAGVRADAGHRPGGLRAALSRR